MTKIVSATRHECCGIGKITLTAPDEENKSKVVNGKLVHIPPADIFVQHIEDGRTRVVCDHLSKGHENPELKNHCLKIQEASRISCFTVLTGKPVQNHGSEVLQESYPCRWIVPAVDEDENV